MSSLSLALIGTGLVGLGLAFVWALVRSGASEDALRARLLPLAERVDNRQHIPLGRRAAHVGLPSVVHKRQ